MKKILIFILLVLVTCFALCACTSAAVPAVVDPTTESSTKASTSKSEDARVPFQMEKLHRYKINYDDAIDYYRDTTTDIMYVCFTGYRKAGLTEMHDPETGLPLTYTRYMEIYNSLEVKE